MDEKNPTKPVTVTAVDEMNRVQKVLDSYTEKMGLNVQNFNEVEEIKRLTNLSRDELVRMHVDECAESAVLISSYGLFIQTQANIEKSRISWCKAQLRRYATPRMRQFSIGSFNHNFDMAVLEDDYTRKVQEILDYAQQRLDRLDSVSYAIRGIADDIKNLERAKRSKGQSYG